MRHILILILIMRIGFVFGQDFSYPILIKESQNINDFIPKNWAVLDSASGYLNKDNYRDFALVFQLKDSVRLISDESDTLITQPRILAILFMDKSINKFKLIDQSNTFILNHDSPNMDDPFVGLKINKNVLSIEFKFWFSCGTWWTSGNTYKFRYNQGNDFDLIGFDSWSMHRATMENNIYSVNFLSKKYSITKEEIIDEKTESKTEWRTFKLDKLKTLKAIERPFNWNFDNVITI